MSSAYIVGPCGALGSHCGVSLSVTVGFVEDEVSLIQVTVRLIRFFPVSIIPPTLQTHLHVHVSVTGRTSGRNLGTLNPFMEIGKRCVGKCCNFCCGFQRVEIFRAISYYVCVCMCVCVCVCVCVQGVSGGIVNILEGGRMDYSEQMSSYKHVHNFHWVWSYRCLKLAHKH